MIKALLLMQYLGIVIWSNPIKRSNGVNMNDTSNQYVQKSSSFAFLKNVIYRRRCQSDPCSLQQVQCKTQYRSKRHPLHLNEWDVSHK